MSIIGVGGSGGAASVGGGRAATELRATER